jgi:hypothetical protein
MRIVLVAMVAMAAAAILPVGLAAAAPRPEVMGDLHHASLREWRQASDGNQLATASDLVERILNLHDPLMVRPKAKLVQACITRVAASFQQGGQAVADTAVACMAEQGMLAR